MARGKHGRGQKRGKKQSSRNKLSKRQKSHLKEFGEQHPSEERLSGREKYKKIDDRVPMKREMDVSSSSESEDEEGVSAYQTLVSSLDNNKKPLTAESDSEEEEAANKDDISKGKSVKGPDDESDSGNASSEAEEESAEGQPVQDREKKGGQSQGDEDDEEDEVDIGDEEEEEISLKETDPFTIHFEQEIADELAERLQQGCTWEKEEVKLPVIGKISHSWPQGATKPEPKVKEKDLRKLHVKKKLCVQTSIANKKAAKVNLQGSDSLTSLQHTLFSLFNTYHDIYYPNRNIENSEEIRLAYCLHALNHVLKTRSRVIAHNSKIKSKRDEVPDDYRDQGLTRPKVLMVLPFRESALRVVNILSNLLTSGDQSFVTNKKRFQKEYGAPEEDEERKGHKPEDFEATFIGNTDDMFRIGLGVAKKSLKIYTDFYSADIILASPLGLRTVIGAEGEEDREFDFLSSIEVLIFDQTDIFLMQNWDHLLHFLNHLHVQPKESHGVDFSRVRMWTLNGWSKFYRQTLIFSSMQTLEINTIFNKHCHNYGGKLQLNKVHPSGTISQIVTTLPHVFHRISASKYSEVPDARFRFFIEKILPEYQNQVKSQTLIFIPSYFDYIRVRNHFKKEEMDFMPMCEYSKDANISRARTFFFHKRIHFLLYTERLHFYRRFKLRGIKHIIFYDLPLYSHFYSEMCNMLRDAKLKQSSEDFTCSVIYSTYDAYKLSGIAGTEKARHMINSEKTVHMFVTGDS